MVSCSDRRTRAGWERLKGTDLSDWSQGPKPFDELLSKLLKKVDPYKNIQQHRSFLVWDEAAGETIAKNARPESIDRGVLLIRVRNPGWSQQLSMMKPELKKKLNRKLGRNVIKDIRFRVGEIEELPLSQSKHEEPDDTVEVTAEVIKEIESEVAKINDPVVREQVKKTLLAAARRSKY